MKQRVLVTMLTCSGVLLAPVAGMAAVLDQSSPVDSGASTNWALGGPSEQMLAQTITVGMAGRMTEVHLPFGCSSGAVVLKVLDSDPVTGGPGTTVLLERSYPAALFPTIAFQSLHLGDGVAVEKGERIAFALSNPTGQCGVQKAPGPYPAVDAYPAGHGFYDARPNAPGWVRLSSVDDMAFRTYCEAQAVPTMSRSRLAALLSLLLVLGLLLRLRAGARSVAG